MKVIIIINYIKYDFTIKCVESIFFNISTNEDITVLIVDNCSPNDSVQVLTETFRGNQKIKIYSMKENLGYARACNYGLKLAREANFKYAIISNNDIIFHEGSIQKMYETISNTYSTVVAPRILDEEGKVTNSVGKNLPSSLIRYYINNLINGKRSEIYDSMTKVNQFSGSCFIVNLDLMNIIGDFDFFTFLYYEENILSKKIEFNKMVILYDPTSVVTHFHGQTTGRVSYLVSSETLISSIYYFYKYTNTSKLILKMYARIKYKSIKRKYKDDDTNKLKDRIDRIFKETSRITSLNRK